VVIEEGNGRFTAQQEELRIGEPETDPFQGWNRHDGVSDPVGKTDKNFHDQGELEEEGIGLFFKIDLG